MLKYPPVVSGPSLPPNPPSNLHSRSVPQHLSPHLTSKLTFSVYNVAFNCYILMEWLHLTFNIYCYLHHNCFILFSIMLFTFCHLFIYFSVVYDVRWLLCPESRKERKVLLLFYHYYYFLRAKKTPIILAWSVNMIIGHHGKSH